MEFISTDRWNSNLWNSVDGIYQEAFGGNGAKPVSIIRNMFEKHLCVLHILIEGKDAVAMALTGSKKKNGNTDY
jgi:hypothetical protein